MTFQELFPKGKAVIAMLHLKGDTREETFARAKREIEIYYRNGVDAILVEDYFGDIPDCEQALAYLQEHYPHKIYGVNILCDKKEAFRLAKQYGAKFIQIDSVCGHLPPNWDEKLAMELKALRADCDALLLGGVRFKYQPVASGRTVAQDLAIGKTRCDAVVVTGKGTGEETPEDKIQTFRQELGDFPLITGAGVTLDTVEETLKRCDGVIVGSWFKKKHNARNEVEERYVQDFVTVAHR